MLDIYPYQTSYAYCSNNPVNRVDRNGLTDYEVNGVKKKIEDGVNNLKISVNQRQFNRLERKFARNNGGYEKYRDKISVKNGYTVSNNSGEVYISETGITVLPSLQAIYYAPGGQSYSDWSNSNSLGPWKEGMPTEAILNGQTFVVSTDNNNYINLYSESLKERFEMIYKMQNNIQGKYWSSYFKYNRVRNAYGSSLFLFHKSNCIIHFPCFSTSKYFRGI